jgi:hypothetical protein
MIIQKLIIPAWTSVAAWQQELNPLQQWEILTTLHFSHNLVLVIPYHQGDVTIMLQNYGDVDMEIPRCTAIGILENLQSDTFFFCTLVYWVSCLKISFLPPDSSTKMPTLPKPSGLTS